MDESSVVEYILTNLSDVETTTAYGYTFFFYKSERKFPFATMISSDQPYDRYSNLDRPGVFRLNIGISKPTFQSWFGMSDVDLKNYDFTALDVIMPHPEYAQYHFVCVLSPGDGAFERVRLLLAEAYDIAVKRYNSQHRDSS